MQHFRIAAFYLCTENTIYEQQKGFNGIMAEEKNRQKVWSFQKECVPLHMSRACLGCFDILKTKLCASFSHNGNLRNSKRKNGECRTVVFAPSGADFCHIPFLRFSQDLR